MIGQIINWGIGLLNNRQAIIEGKATARASILTSWISGLGFIVFSGFICGRLFLLELGLYSPANLEAFSQLNEYLIWLTASMLGISLPTGFIGGRAKGKALREAILQHEEEEEEREREAKVNKVAAAIELRINRNYADDDDGVYSTCVLYRYEKRGEENYEKIVKWRGKIYELPRRHRGKRNVPSKTCVPEGAYFAEWEPTSATGGFGQTGIYRLANVPGRSGILIHYAGSEKKPSVYTRGCLCPYDRINERGRLEGNIKAMKELVRHTGREKMRVVISS